MSLHPKDIHIGEIFYECGGFGNVKMRAITEPYKNKDNAWVWIAEHIKTGDHVNYLWTGCGYGPSLYDYPAYAGVPDEAYDDDYMPSGANT